MADYSATPTAPGTVPGRQIVVTVNNSSGTPALFTVSPDGGASQSTPIDPGGSAQFTFDNNGIAGGDLVFTFTNNEDLTDPDDVVVHVYATDYSVDANASTVVQDGSSITLTFHDLTGFYTGNGISESDGDFNGVFANGSTQLSEGATDTYAPEATGTLDTVTLSFLAGGGLGTIDPDPIVITSRPVATSYVVSVTGPHKVHKTDHVTITPLPTGAVFPAAMTVSVTDVQNNGYGNANVAVAGLMTYSYAATPLRVGLTQLTFGNNSNGSVTDPDELDLVIGIGSHPVRFSQLTDSGIPGHFPGVM